MGFGAARPAAKPTMLVGFMGAAGSAEAAFEAGADIILLEGQVGAAQIKELRAKVGDKPLGVSTPVGRSLQAKEMREGGLDFLLVDVVSGQAASLLDDELGYVISLPERPEEPFLRSLEAISLEALVLRVALGSLTVARQIELGRIALLTHRPLLCRVVSDASPDELMCLRAAGAVALLSSSPQGVTQLKGTVAALPARKQNRDDRPVVSLPRGQTPQPEEEDDDDE